MNRKEDLIVWQEAIKFTERIQAEFASCNDYEFKKQIQSIAFSIPRFIAEGFETNCKKEFVDFLYISKSLTSEVRTQLFLAKQLRIINDSKAEIMREQTRKISTMLINLIQSKKEELLTQNLE